MKLYAYINDMTLDVTFRDRTRQLDNEELIGTIEVDEPGKEIKPDTSVRPPKFIEFNEGYDGKKSAPKKTVTKLAESRGPTGEGDQSGYIEKFFIPANAKNIKCTYEVEE
jgi:hypothetical protein